jgi:integrase/recombinase XerD
MARNPPKTMVSEATVPNGRGSTRTDLQLARNGNRMTTSDDLVNSFLGYLRAERGAGENTLASYGHDVRNLSAWLEKPLLEATRIDLQKYISDSLKQGIGARSVARRLSCLRHFFRFLIDEEEIEIDPTRNLPVPKGWKTVPKPLSLTDLDSMVASLGSSWLDVRDKAILLTFFASGLRESELTALKVQDLDLDAGAAKVWDGKGGKDGIVPLSPPAIAALREYFANVRPKLDNRPKDRAGVRSEQECLEDISSLDARRAFRLGCRRG